MTQDEFARLRPLDITAVEIDDDFWNGRLEALRETTIDFVYDRLVESGRIEHFRIAAGLTEGEFSGRMFNDSDVYKWIEAASYLLSTGEDPELRERVDEIVPLIAAAQEDDGYLNTYFTLVEPDKKWTNLNRMHELYCAGHLFEAAVAHRRATGEDALLDVATRLADHIDDRFGPDGELGVPGHEEIELALVKLSRETGEERYLDLARFFVENRGREDSPLKEEALNPEGRAGETLPHFLDENGEYDGSYAQDHAPTREQDAAEGHAVRATYFYTGMADVAMETGDRELYEALERIWTNVTTRRMYVTGGIGSSHVGERFTEDYDLPNDVAYAETCAALGNVIWNRRMFQLTGESRFGDVAERTLYNGLLAGLSLDGTRFFYVNPLEVTGGEHPLNDVDPRRFSAERQGWFETACCPTNVPRLLASLAEHVYFRGPSGDDLYVNLHVGSAATTTAGGAEVTVEQETAFPWEAETTVRVSPAEPTAFRLRLRVPGWCEDPTVSVNGTEADAETEDGFVVLSRTWEAGDEVEFSAALPVEAVRAHPGVEADAGTVAIRRGPIVYCLEAEDNPRPLHQIELDPDGEFASRFESDLLDGVTVVEVDGRVPDLDGWDDALYRDDADASTESVRVRAVPYYGWGHRGTGDMRVWIRAGSD